jgi:hypothetical protein
MLNCRHDLAPLPVNKSVCVQKAFYAYIALAT